MFIIKKAMNLLLAFFFPDLKLSVTLEKKRLDGKIRVGPELPLG